MPQHLATLTSIALAMMMAACSASAERADKDERVENKQVSTTAAPPAPRPQLTPTMPTPAADVTAKARVREAALQSLDRFAVDADLTEEQRAQVLQALKRAQSAYQAKQADLAATPGLAPEERKAEALQRMQALGALRARVNADLKKELLQTLSKEQAAAFWKSVRPTVLIASGAIE